MVQCAEIPTWGHPWRLESWSLNMHARYCFGYKTELQEFIGAFNACEGEGFEAYAREMPAPRPCCHAATEVEISLSCRRFLTWAKASPSKSGTTPSCQGFRGSSFLEFAGLLQSEEGPHRKQGQGVAWAALFLQVLSPCLAAILRS